MILINFDYSFWLSRTSSIIITRFFWFTSDDAGQ